MGFWTADRLTVDTKLGFDRGNQILPVYQGQEESTLITKEAQLRFLIGERGFRPRIGLRGFANRNPLRELSDCR